MNKRQTYFFVFLGVSLFVIGLLVTGSPLLTVALDDKQSVPLGTFIYLDGAYFFTNDNLLEFEYLHKTKEKSTYTPL